MTELAAMVLSFPTVIFTVLLSVTLVYWLFVVIGAIDLDALGAGHADGLADGALEGGLKGAAEGAIKGVAEGAVKGVAEGAIKGVTEGAVKGVADGAVDGAPDGFAGFLSALRLQSAPVTVVVTLFALFGWLFCALVMQALGSSGGVLPGWLLGVVVLFAGSIVSLLATSVVIRPLGRVFITRVAKGRSDLIGRVCVVSTGRVDSKFGQATVEDGGAGLILPVRCETEGALHRGDRALIIEWDDAREGFVVEPIDPMERPMPPATPVKAQVRVAAGTEAETGAGAGAGAETEAGAGAEAEAEAEAEAAAAAAAQPPLPSGRGGRG